MKIKKFKGKTPATSPRPQCTPAYEYVIVSLGDIMAKAAKRRRAQQAAAKSA